MLGNAHACRQRWAVDPFRDLCHSNPGLGVKVQNYSLGSSIIRYIQGFYSHESPSVLVL